MKSNDARIYNQELFREYRGSHGMSISGDISPERSFAYLQNMYIDHEGGGDSVESIPGYRRVYSPRGNIHSLAIQGLTGESYILIHEDNMLLRLKYPFCEAERIAEINDGDSHIFALGCLCIINDGKSLYSFDGESLSLLCSESYIAECSVATLFDGRLFMSGNKAHPGKIFYSTRRDEGELVFSQDKYISCLGEVISLLSQSGRLWVLRQADAGEGVITCHKADEGYPILKALSGVCPTGQAIVTEREILLLCEDGPWAIESAGDDGIARLTRLSGGIEPMLIREDMASACLCYWRGYLAIGCGERIYLCDRRSADSECNWYFLTGIGSHPGDRRVYRYSPTAREGYLAHKLTHTHADGEVISLTLEDGSRVYYTEENGNKYQVYPTEERTGGSLSPAEVLFSDGKLLCFYARGGIFLFNSDMRGVPPESIKGGEDFYREEYERLHGHRIHRELYSFDGHAPRYVIATKYDSCGLTLTEKTSVEQSLALKLKASGRVSLNVSVFTDKGRSTKQTLTVLPNDRQEYGYGDQTCIVGLIEHAHGWVEKQIVIEGCEFASPFGLCSLAFKYQPKDKLKKG